jgi:hypothetical protein
VFDVAHTHQVWLPGAWCPCEPWLLLLSLTLILAHATWDQGQQKLPGGQLACSCLLGPSSLLAHTSALPTPLPVTDLHGGMTQNRQLVKRWCGLLLVPSSSAYAFQVPWCPWPASAATAGDAELVSQGWG